MSVLEPIPKPETQSKDELAHIRLLHKISTLIQQENTDDLYKEIISAAVSVMHSNFATIQMLYPERGISGELRLLAHSGFADEDAKQWEWVGESNGTICAIALKEQKRVTIVDTEAQDCRLSAEDLKPFHEIGIRACQSTPLFSRSGKLVGMLSTHWSKPCDPSEYELKLMDILARQAADLIERKKTDEMLKESEELKRLIIESSEDCIKVLDLEGHILSMNQSGCQILEIDDITPYLNQSWVGF